MQECKALRGKISKGLVMTRFYPSILITFLVAGTIFATPSTREASFLDAVKSGNAAAVKSLLAEKVDVNAAAADSSTALHLAVAADNLEMADALIAAGANVKAVTRYNITPL